MPVDYRMNALNFEPINQGLNSLGQGYLRNQQLGMEQQRQASELKTQGLQQKQIQGNITKQHLDLMGGLIQDVNNEQDPAIRQQKWAKVLSVDPQAADDLRRVGIDPNDHVNAPAQLTAMMRGYEDPGRLAQEKATLAKTQAETEALGRKDAFAETFNKILGEPGASPQQPSAAPMVQPQSYQQPQPSGPMLQPISDTGGNALNPPQATFQPAADDTTDEAKALPEPQAANPGAVYNLPPNEIVNTPAGPMPRERALRLGMAAAAAGKGDLGKMFTDAASGGQQKLGRNSVAANDKAEMAAVDNLANLDFVRRDFQSKFQTIPNRFTQWTRAAWEKVGGTLSPQDKKDLTDYTNHRQNAWHVANTTLKNLSGTAVTENEMQRQMRDLPNPGTGIFDGDAPTEFEAKLNRSFDFARSAIARSRWLRSQGFTGKPWEAKNPFTGGKLAVEDMPGIINKRGTELEQQLQQQNPQADPGAIKGAVKQQLNKEFGI